GFIEGPNGEVDWCVMDDDMNFEGFIESIDTIFYGRVSYDAWGNFQPVENMSEGERRMWQGIHSKKKFVFSRHERKDEKASFISNNIPEKVAEIKQHGDKDIWLYGGADLI